MPLTSDAHITTLDLNLLRLFDVMMQERSVTRAGQRLGLTQSAVSHALGRLRFTLKDELFVRGFEGMRPTPWAAEVAPKIHLALEQLQDALTVAAFDPSVSERRFTVAASPYPSEVLAPAMFARFRREAPRAELILHSLEASVADELDTGRIDLAIAAFGRAPDRFDCERLFEDRLVWAMRADHPAAGEPLTVEALARLPRLVVAASRETADGGYVSDGGLERRVVWDDRGAPLEAMDGHGGSVCMVQNAITALAVAACTDFVTLTPRRIAQMYADRRQLKLFEPPYASEPAAFSALSRKDHGGRPAMSWFRALLREEAAQL